MREVPDLTVTDVFAFPTSRPTCRILSICDSLRSKHLAASSHAFRPHVVPDGRKAGPMDNGVT